MPKSKRAKVVSLTQTPKKTTKGNKERIVAEIRGCLDSYKFMYVLSLENFRTNAMKDIRMKWPTSRFFLTKNKLMQLALGRTPEEEYKQNVYKACEYIRGSAALLFTNNDEKEVKKFFSELNILDYARSGHEIQQAITFNEGPLPQFQHSMEPLLRQLGLPTILKDGIILLERDYSVCKSGDKLTPEQAKILTLFDMKLVEFKINLIGVWISDTNAFKLY